VTWRGGFSPTVEWVVIAYLLLLRRLLSGGALSDRLGLRRHAGIGLSIFIFRLLSLAALHQPRHAELGRHWSKLSARSS